MEKLAKNGKNNNINIVLDKDQEQSSKIEESTSRTAKSSKSLAHDWRKFRKERTETEVKDRFRATVICVLILLSLFAIIVIIPFLVIGLRPEEGNI